jgi:aspartate kinase
MRSHAGVAARFFECLGKAGINIQLVSTSEIKIAVLIPGEQGDNAAQIIHHEFGLARLAPTLPNATRPLG